MMVKLHHWALSNFQNIQANALLHECSVLADFDHQN